MRDGEDIRPIPGRPGSPSAPSSPRSPFCPGGPGGPGGPLMGSLSWLACSGLPGRLELAGLQWLTVGCSTTQLHRADAIIRLVPRLVSLTVLPPTAASVAIRLLGWRLSRRADERCSLKRVDDDKKNKKTAADLHHSDWTVGGLSATTVIWTLPHPSSRMLHSVPITCCCSRPHARALRAATLDEFR